MRHGIKPLQPVFPTDGQTIHGKHCLAVRQVIPTWLKSQPLAASRPLDSLAAIAAKLVASKSAGLFHAMQLTSGKLSLQSP